MAKKHVDIEINELRLNRNETLTVYLQTNKYGEEYNSAPVELRVREDGKPEIFFDPALIEGQEYESWYNMNPGPKTPKCKNCLYYKPCEAPNSDRVACGHYTDMGWPHYNSKCRNWSPMPAETLKQKREKTNE